MPLKTRSCRHLLQLFDVLFEFDDERRLSIGQRRFFGEFEPGTIELRDETISLQP
jgi:hypothetical protein